MLLLLFPEGNRHSGYYTAYRQAGYRYQETSTSITLPFPDALSAMRSLKGIGATHLHQGRSSQPLTRGRLQQLQLAWPSQAGECPLTYHLFTGVITRD